MISGKKFEVDEAYRKIFNGKGPAADALRHKFIEDFREKNLLKAIDNIIQYGENKPNAKISETAAESVPGPAPGIEAGSRHGPRTSRI